MEPYERAIRFFAREAKKKEPEQRAQVTCMLRDVEGKAYRVPKAWRGACADEVLRKMLHVKHWVPFIVQEVIEVKVKK